MIDAHQHEFRGRGAVDWSEAKRSLAFLKWTDFKTSIRIDVGKRESAEAIVALVGPHDGFQARQRELCRERFIHPTFDRNIAGNHRSATNLCLQVSDVAVDDVKGRRLTVISASWTWHDVDCVAAGRQIVDAKSAVGSASTVTAHETTRTAINDDREAEADVWRRFPTVAIDEAAAHRVSRHQPCDRDVNVGLVFSFR